MPITAPLEASVPFVASVTHLTQLSFPWDHNTKGQHGGSICEDAAIIVIRLFSATYSSYPKELSKAEGALQNLNTRNVVTKTAEEANQWWKAKGLDKPPVREGTKVMEAELREETSGFVRVYDDVNSFQKGGWLMRKEDIIDLTPAQIKDKFALQYVPKYVTDVKLPADTRIRISEAGEIPGWGKGGGTQIDLLNERVGEFFNPRSLEGKWW